MITLIRDPQVLFFLLKFKLLYIVLQRPITDAKKRRIDQRIKEVSNQRFENLDNQKD